MVCDTYNITTGDEDEPTGFLQLIRSRSRDGQRSAQLRTFSSSFWWSNSGNPLEEMAYTVRNSSHCIVSDRQSKKESSSFALCRRWSFHNLRIVYCTTKRGRRWCQRRVQGPCRFLQCSFHAEKEYWFWNIQVSSVPSKWRWNDWRFSY